MKISVLTIFTLFVLVSCTASKTRTHEINASNYSEIHIGDQVWMARNLEVATFRNGDSIPQVKSYDEWENAGKEGRPAWCYYGNDTGIGKKYGRMYNWFAVNDPRGLAPEGWHIPTNDEWIILENYVGISNAGTQLKCDTGHSHISNNKSKNFCALLGGYRDRNGNFTGMGEFTYLSGITQDTLPDLKGDERFFIWGRGLHVENITMMRCGLDKKFGLYVRCIKD